MSLRQVEIFVALAETLHFGRAADRLHIAQATASQELKRLEVQLGLRLLTRSTRAANLTPAGEALLGDAQALLDASHRLSERARLFQAEYLHRVRLVASPSVVNKLLPAVIRRADAELPDTTIEEISADTGTVIAEMSRQGGDIAIGRFLAPPPRFVRETLATEECVAILSADHPLAGQESIDLSELTDLPLLLWSREQAPDYYDALLGICHDRGLNPMILVSPPRIVGTRSYLLSEMRAFSIVPRSTAYSLPPEVRAIPVTPRAELPLHLVFREADPRDSVRATLTLIREAAMDLLR